MSEQEQPKQELIERPKVPTLTIEIHGDQLLIKYIITPETNVALFSIFLHKLQQGGYEKLLTSSLLNAGQQLGLTNLTNKIVEQFLVMHKGEQVAMRPRDTLKLKGE